MNRYAFFLKYALNGLQRGGQRVVIAVLAVAFGVMSLIAMTSVSDAINRTVYIAPYLETGGDLKLTRPERTFGTSALETLPSNSVYSPVRESYGLLMRAENSGTSHMIQRGVGIDPTAYPIVGDVQFSQPEDSSFADLLQNENTVLVTQDIATEFNLSVGDTIWLAQMEGPVNAIPLTVTGILSNTPDQRGGRIYYNMQTAQTLIGAEDIISHVLMASDDPPAIASELEAAGWEVTIPGREVQSPGPAMEFFGFMLRGAGILGLIVGGIGIANTMQVLLARRRQEVGILKSMGYAQRDMILIFALEAGLLGIIGSLIGAFIAVLISNGLVSLFAGISTLLVQWQFSVPLIGSGILIGIITTILFASYAILRTSNIRPTAIFRREMAESKNWRDGLKMLGFYALIAVPFAMISSFVLGSLIQGIGILLFALAALIVLSIMISLFTWVTLRLMPTFRFNLLKMARNNMRKRAFSMLFPMIALFTGIFTLGFVATVIQVSLDEYGTRIVSSNDYNVMIYSEANTTLEVETLLEQSGATATNHRYTLFADQVTSNTDNVHQNQLDLRERAWDFEVVQGPEFGADPGIYVYEESSINLGEELTVTLNDETRIMLPVIGHYTPDDSLSLLGVYSPIASVDLFPSQELQVITYAIVDPAQENNIAMHISQQLPQAMVITHSNTIEVSNAMFLNLFNFALAMASLALLAGVMLIANIVSLAMMERRYEIGVMKAVGYTQRHIIITLALEYLLIGFIASVLALIGVQVAIILISMAQSAAQGLLWMKPTTALLVLVVGISLTLVTALVSAWQPAHIRPLIVLNE